MKHAQLFMALALASPLLLPTALHAQAIPTSTKSDVEQTVDVITQAPVIQTDDAITTSIQRDLIQVTPGAYQDIPRFLQTLPGVTYDTDARNTYLVNGGNPLENLYVVDGVEVPNINHISSANTSGGFVSMIDSDDISFIKLHKMLYGPQYSGALSSVLEIKTRDVEELGLHGDVSVGYAGADVVLMHSIGKVGATVTEFRKSVVNYVTNDIGIDGVPKYWSLLSKDIFGITDSDTLSFLVLGGDDSLNIKPNLNDSEDPGFVNTDYTGNRFTLAGTWEHSFSPATTQRFQLAYSRVKSTSTQTDAIVDAIHHGQLIDDDTLIDSPATAKYDFTTSTSHFDLRGGLFGSIHAIDYTILQPNGFQNPYTQNPAYQNANNVQVNTTPRDYAGYGEITYKTDNGFNVSAGGRLQHFGLPTSQNNIFSPRVSLRTPAYKGFFLYGGGAKYAQLAPLPTIFGQPVNAQLKPITVDQYQVGLNKRTDNDSRFSVSVYRKLYHDYPVSTQYPSLSLADIVDTFGLPFIYLPMTSAGTGTATGGEIEAATDPGKRFFVSGNVATQKVEHKALDGIARPANYDVPILANLLAGYRLTQNQRLTTRVGYHTGTPYIPFLFQESLRQERSIYDLTQINTQRGPNYFRLDLRYEIDLTVFEHALNIYVGLDNATARKNFYQYVFIPHCPQCTGPYELTQQGFLAEGGIAYRF
jgi:hypothetical protein